MINSLRSLMYMITSYLRWYESMGVEFCAMVLQISKTCTKTGICQISRPISRLTVSVNRSVDWYADFQFFRFRVCFDLVRVWVGFSCLYISFFTRKHPLSSSDQRNPSPLSPLSNPKLFLVIWGRNRRIFGGIFSLQRKESLPLRSRSSSSPQRRVTSRPTLS